VALDREPSKIPPREAKEPERFLEERSLVKRGLIICNKEHFGMALWVVPATGHREALELEPFFVGSQSNKNMASIGSSYIFLIHHSK
jgi:hypothetical protein